MKGSLKMLIIALIVATGLAGYFFGYGRGVDEGVRVVKEETQDQLQRLFDGRRTKDAPLTPTTLATQTVTLGNGTELSFQVAEPFKLAVAADDLGKARFMTMSPDGRMFVPDLVNYNLSHAGRVFILEDFNEETGSFATKHTYLSELRGPNSVAFYTDKDGQTWLYLALTAHLVRYPYESGDTVPSSEPETIMEFPNTQTPGETSVVWHITRTLLFAGDRLYIAIGSGCNSCEQLESALRGMIITMDPDGSNVEVYADGLRNSVGIAWADGALYTTANGVDHLGSNAPDERMFKIMRGEHYGWPYCYELDGVLYPETSQEWDEPISCEDVPLSLAAFPPRSAPLGLEYFTDTLPVLENAFLVALHGSFDASMRSGYQIVRVSDEGAQEVFIDGFQREDGTVIARPVDILQRDENSFFFTDDFGGRVYYVYAGEI